MLAHEGIAPGDHLHAGRRIGEIIELAVCAQHTGRKHPTGLVVEAAAGYVEGRAALRHHLIGSERDRAADRRPFTDAMDHLVQMTTPLAQARSEERRVGKECGSTCRYRG